MSRRTLQHPEKYEGGFTLTEVLIAMVVLSIGLLGLSAMMIAASGSLAFGKKLTTATILAQETIEAIKNTPYTSVITANYSPEDYQTIPGHAQFKRVVTISAGPLHNAKTVLVTTSWQRQASSEPYSVTLRTIINSQ
jgi:type IV pilus assembly protein PilV